MTDPTDAPRRATVFPPPEVLAYVRTGTAPAAAPDALADAVEPVLLDDQLVDWELATHAPLRPGLVREFWQWRSQWTATWPMGPLSNVDALVRILAESGAQIGPHVGLVLEVVARAEDERFGGEVLPHVDPADLALELASVRHALAVEGRHRHGAAMVDDMPQRPGRSRLLRSWAPMHEPLLLAADDVTSVLVAPGDGLTVHCDAPVSRTLGDIARVDLLGDVAVVESRGGERLELAPHHARALAWLAPASLRWHVEEIPLADVWSGLLDGIGDAVDVAVAAGTVVRFCTRFTTT